MIPIPVYIFVFLPLAKHFILISRRTIDTVFETAQVEEVIGDFIQLKRAGSNFKGLSPFTDERTPSFMVSPSKQIWKDFSSGKGGNVVSFLMEHEHFSYPEAIRFLAKKYGIEIEETEQTPEEKEQADERESLYLVNEFATNYFHETLLKSEEGKAIGLTYFKERGFTDEILKTFQLGYSPDAWEAFTNHALKNKFKLEFLQKTGLTIVREDAQTGEVNRKFDRFKGRVMFPIKSMSGRTLGFGGRILTSDKKAAKYLNSPESEIYHKSNILYGIFEAKQSISKEDNCYLVEGYTDVIQMHQTGVENVVSSSGTALTPNQIRLINRLTQNIVVLFDGDPAGLRAAIRGVDLILEQGMNVRICTFPEGEDPDSFARKSSKEELQRYLEDNAKDFITFKASLLAEEAQNDPIRKAETIQDMIVSISKIGDPIKRELYVRECSRIMDISEEVLFNVLAQSFRKQERESRKKPEKTGQPFEVISPEKEPVEKINIQEELEHQIIEILILYGHLEETFREKVFMEKGDNDDVINMEQKCRIYEKIFMDLQADETEFANPRFRKVYEELMRHFTQNPEKDAASFINSMPAEVAAVVSDVLMEDERYQLHKWETRDINVKGKLMAVSQIVSETILSFRRFLVDQKISELSENFKQRAEKNTGEEGEEANSASEDLQVVMDYIGLKKLLSNRLNRVI